MNERFDVDVGDATCREDYEDRLDAGDEGRQARGDIRREETHAQSRPTPLAFGALPSSAEPITIKDCGTRSQLLTVEALVDLGVDVVLVERGVGLARPLRVLANGHLVEILPYGGINTRAEAA